MVIGVEEVDLGHLAVFEELRIILQLVGELDTLQVDVDTKRVVAGGSLVPQQVLGAQRHFDVGAVARRKATR